MAGPHSSGRSYGWGWRHVVTFISFVGFFVLYTMRVNLSVAQVAMVNHTAIANASNTSKVGESICPSSSGKNDKVNGPFLWSTKRQGIVLASFFYGYIFTQIPGGWLAGEYGAKWVFGLGSLWTAVLTLLSVVAAEASPLDAGWLIALRVFEGLGEGVTWPAMQSLFSRWAPPSERSKLPAFAYAGCFVGTPLTFSITGAMIEAGFMGGWPSAFYVFGILGCIWFVFWAIFVDSSPEQSKWTSKAERDFIVGALEAEQAGGKVKAGWADVPWMAILKSPPVWATMYAHFTYSWSLYNLILSLPDYFKRVLGFDLKDNGLYSAIPYIVQATIHASSGSLADMLRMKYHLQTITVRKLFDCLGHLLPGIFVFFVGFVDCSGPAAITLLVLTIGTSGLCGAGFFVNFLDIAPPFAGILFGISNAIATIPGIIGPTITASITESNTVGSWKAVFSIMSVLYFSSVVVFFFFGQGTVQPWAQPKGYKIVVVSQPSLPPFDETNAMLQPTKPEGQPFEQPIDLPAPPQQTTSISTADLLEDESNGKLL